MLIEINVDKERDILGFSAYQGDYPEEDDNAICGNYVLSDSLSCTLGDVLEEIENLYFEIKEQREREN